MSILAQYILDEWVPPRIRDSKLFMSLPMKLVLGNEYRQFMSFKEWFYGASSHKISKLYESTADAQQLQGETDLNEACVDEILKTVQAKSILEVGCGRGYLANLLQRKLNTQLTACDIVVDKEVAKKYPNVHFTEANVEQLKFDDNSFDTVVCTHTLEHTKDLQQAMRELRRVAKKELIVVVPRQRPYKYTFSLHTHFFPYDWSIYANLGYRKKSSLKKLGDWFYYEKDPQP